MNRPESPEWYNREMEYQYRKGFYHGMAEASELISDLYRRGGYVRPQEIANLLGDWCNDLRHWKSSAVTEQPLKRDHGTPSLKWIPWMDLKAQALVRDGGVCVHCGSSEKLESHHIDPVKQGGLPVLKNILTLCFVCHRKGDGL